MIDVVCFGLGPIGARIARRVLARSDLRLAGAVDADPAKIGHDLGAVIGAPPVGLPVVRDLDELRDGSRRTVALHATSSSLATVAPQLEALAGHGYNVVSTCEELAWPYDTPALVARLDKAARADDVSMIGSGINPGYLLDTLPLVLSAVCVRVDAVRVRRVVDTDRRREPLQRKAGVGITADEFRARAAAGAIGHVGLRQSAFMLADGLGWTLDGYRETIEPVIAAIETKTGIGVVPAGGVLGQRQVVVATAGGRDVIRYDLQMSADAAPIDAIEIDGDPPLRQVIEGGVNGDIGTEAVVVNLIPVVAAAAPGLLTMRDLYPLTGKAHEAQQRVYNQADS